MNTNKNPPPSSSRSNKDKAAGDKKPTAAVKVDAKEIPKKDDTSNELEELRGKLLAKEEELKSLLIEHEKLKESQALMNEIIVDLDAWKNDSQARSARNETALKKTADAYSNLTESYKALAQQLAGEVALRESLEQRSQELIDQLKVTEEAQEARHKAENLNVTALELSKEFKKKLQDQEKSHGVKIIGAFAVGAVLGIVILWVVWLACGGDRAWKHAQSQPSPVVTEQLPSPDLGAGMSQNASPSSSSVLIFESSPSPTPMASLKPRVASPKPKTTARPQILPKFVPATPAYTPPASPHVLPTQQPVARKAPVVTHTRPIIPRPTQVPVAAPTPVETHSGLDLDTLAKEREEAVQKKIHEKEGE